MKELMKAYQVPFTAMNRCASFSKYSYTTSLYTRRKKKSLL